MHIDLQLIFDVIAGITIVAAGSIYLFSYIRKNDLQTLREANQDLRNSIEDKSKKIDELTLKVNVLEQKVSKLEIENNDLQILVKEALVIYFTRYPKVADNMSQDNKG